MQRYYINTCSATNSDTYVYVPYVSLGHFGVYLPLCLSVDLDIRIIIGQCSTFS